MSSMSDFYPLNGPNIDIDISNLELPIANGGSRSYMGNSQKMINIIKTNGKPEPGQRDSQAGIQYFPMRQGVNPKTMIQPIIAPRSFDQDVWGNTSVVRGEVNKQTIRDITDELDVDEMADRAGTKRELGTPIVYQPRTPGSRVPQNYVGEPTPFASYPGGQMLYGGMDERDYNSEVLPMYREKKSYPMEVEKMREEPRNSYNYDPREQISGDIYRDLQLFPTEENIVDTVESNMQPTRKIQYGGNEPDFMGTQSFAGTQPSREGFAVHNRSAPRREGFAYPPAPYGGAVQSTDGVKKVTSLEDLFYNEGSRMVPSPEYYDVMNRVPPGQNVQVTPVTDTLLQASPTYAFTDEYFKQPQTKLFMQDIQPKLYSYAVEQVPINSNIGITYTPQRPPKVLDQITDLGMAYPLYSRIDPQLVRTDGTPGMLERQPERTNWSSEYSNWSAAPGTVNFEDIYDPRFNSYGDPYRSYSDINLGQVQYYYDDVDAYRRPNFITRSNVDFIEFTNPNGQVWPYYNRTASIDDVRAQVENQTAADELSFRQDMMESLMAKANRESWQQRQAPLRRTANPGGFTFGPGA